MLKKIRKKSKTIFLGGIQCCFYSFSIKKEFKTVFKNSKEKNGMLPKNAKKSINLKRNYGKIRLQKLGNSKGFRLPSAVVKSFSTDLFEMKVGADSIIFSAIKQDFSKWAEDFRKSNTFKNEIFSDFETKKLLDEI